MPALLRHCAVSVFAILAAQAACQSEAVPVAPRELAAERPRPPSSAAPPASLAVAAVAAEPPPVTEPLLPCAGLADNPSYCAPRLIAIAEGALARARTGLAACADCRDRDRRQHVVERLESHVRHLKKERTVVEFRAAMKRGEIDEAAQLLADADVPLDPDWLKSARRWLTDVGRAEDDADCKLSHESASLISPSVAVSGERVRVLVTLPAPAALEGNIVGPGGSTPHVHRELSGAGPPAWRAMEFTPAEPGQYRYELRATDGRRVLCRRVGVRSRRLARVAPSTPALWASPRGWEADDEKLYAAFVEQLFSDREGRRFHGLDEVTRDRDRNLLFDHNAPGEDRGLKLRPDCADAPYFLRAYFAFKLGLPFGWHDCAELPCQAWHTNLGAAEAMPALASSAPGPGEPAGATPAFERFLRHLREVIVARGLRVPLAAERSDFYPVGLDRASLRPGTVFSDPYGHTLTLVRWEDPVGDKPGKLIAVDAQPDGSLGIKRFWRGTFVFTDAEARSGHGFKAFRPITIDQDGEPRLLTNPELAAAHGFVPPSFEQRSLSASEFYKRVERIVRPPELSAEAELDALLEALLDQLRARVDAIAIAEELVRERHQKVIEMPRGREVFHTSGAWEALSTPCRDLRLLVGLDIVRSFPASHPERRDALERHLSERGAALSFEYRRSDGQAERLTVSEVLRRQPALDMAYNPNDCPEVRWGAPDGSAERRSCTRNAPADQRKRMFELRHWFQKRYACG